MIIDMKEQKQVAELRLYGMLYVRDNFPPEPNQYNPDVPKYGPVWGTRYHNKLPCKVSVYTTNTPEIESSWKRLGHFEQGASIPNNERWCERCATADYKFLLTEDQIRDAEPAYMSISLPAPGELCRYVKIVVEDVFDYQYGLARNQNPNEYVTFHELELYTKKN